MAKKFTPFRLGSETLNMLAELQTLKGKNRTILVETAIELYYSVELSKKQPVRQPEQAAIQQKSDSIQGKQANKLLNYGRIFTKSRVE